MNNPYTMVGCDYCHDIYAPARGYGESTICKKCHDKNSAEYQIAKIKEALKKLKEIEKAAK